MTSSISISIEPNVFDQDFDCRFSIKLLRLRFLQDFCPRLRLKSKVLDRNEDHFDCLFFCTNFRESVGKLFCKCNYYGGKSSFKLPVICKSPFRRENLCSPEIICRMKAPYFLTAFSKGNEIQHMKSKSKTFSINLNCRIFIGDFSSFTFFHKCFLPFILVPRFIMHFTSFALSTQAYVQD